MDGEGRTEKEGERGRRESSEFEGDNNHKGTNEYFWDDFDWDRAFTEGSERVLAKRDGTRRKSDGTCAHLLRIDVICRLEMGNALKSAVNGLIEGYYKCLTFGLWLS